MADYIDRGQLLSGWNGVMFDEEQRRLIKSQPRADVEPVRHGKWVLRGGKRFCSLCGERACVTRDTEDFWYTKGTAFCPNCGAKMGLEVGK